MAAVTRRRMLSDLAGAALLLAGAPRVARAASAETIEEWLAASFGELDLAELRSAVAELSRSVLGADPKAAVLAGRRSGESIAVLIERKCREDFERGRIVSAAGWRLSHTEARLLSLRG